MSIEPITFDVVRPYDPEIVAHNEVSVLARYMSQRDMSLLTIPDGAQPVIYHCRVLSRDQHRVVSELSSSSRQSELAFRFGIVEIKNLERPNGTRETVLVQRKKPRDALTDEDLDRLGAAAAQIDIQDVGMVIRVRSFLAPRLPLGYPLLDSSRDECVLAFARHAVQLKEVETQPEESPA